MSMMWNGPFGMMGGSGWFWPFHFIFPLLFLALTITVVVMLVRYATGQGDQPPRREHRPPGLDVLEERYARGEINRDEYLQEKHDILGIRLLDG
jgi:putative membrane protein